MWKESDNSNKFCLVSSWEVNDLQIVAYRCIHTLVYHISKAISGKHLASMPVTKICCTESTKSFDLFYVWIVIRFYKDLTSENAHRAGDETYHRRVKSYLFILYGIWERKALTDQISQQRTFSLPSCYLKAKSYRLIPATQSLLFNPCM